MPVFVSLMQQGHSPSYYRDHPQDIRHRTVQSRRPPPLTSHLVKGDPDSATSPSKYPDDADSPNNHKNRITRDNSAPYVDNLINDVFSQESSIQKRTSPHAKRSLPDVTLVDINRKTPNCERGNSMESHGLISLAEVKGAIVDRAALQEPLDIDEELEAAIEEAAETFKDDHSSVYKMFHGEPLKFRTLSTSSSDADLSQKLKLKKTPLPKRKQRRRRKDSSPILVEESSKSKYKTIKNEKKYMSTTDNNKKPKHPVTLLTSETGESQLSAKRRGISRDSTPKTSSQKMQAEQMLEKSSKKSKNIAQNHDKVHTEIEDFKAVERLPTPFELGRVPKRQSTNSTSDTSKLTHTEIRNFLYKSKMQMDVTDIQRALHNAKSLAHNNEKLEIKHKHRDAPNLGPASIGPHKGVENGSNRQDKKKGNKNPAKHIETFDVSDKYTAKQISKIQSKRMLYKVEENERKQTNNCHETIRNKNRAGLEAIENDIKCKTDNSSKTQEKQINSTISKKLGNSTENLSTFVTNICRAGPPKMKQDSDESAKRLELIKAARSSKHKANLSKPEIDRQCNIANKTRVSLPIVLKPDGSKKAVNVKKKNKTASSAAIYADSNEEFYKEFRIIYVNLPIPRDELPREYHRIVFLVF